MTCILKQKLSMLLRIPLQFSTGGVLGKQTRSSRMTACSVCVLCSFVFSKHFTTFWGIFFVLKESSICEPQCLGFYKCLNRFCGFWMEPDDCTLLELTGPPGASQSWDGYIPLGQTSPTKLTLQELTASSLPDIYLGSSGLSLLHQVQTQLSSPGANWPEPATFS